MASTYIAEMSRLDNEYRALMVQAQTINSANNNTPSRAEAEKYKIAAEICGQLANLSVGAEREHWVARQNDASQKLRNISLRMNPRAAENTPGKQAPSKEAEQPKATKKKEPVSQETVDSWFKNAPKHGFEAVSGMEDVKAQLQECVKDVAASALNQYLGMDMVHSFFFYGLPGCGKTFIVEAFANELMKQGYKYMSLSGGDIHSSLVGEAEKIVERAFQEAEKNAPCIMFVDEIDSVCRNRSLPNVPAHAMSTTTAFLTGYNGITESDKPIIFIGATNYPNLVDSAMMDRVEPIKIPLPDAEARAHAFEMKFSNIIRNEYGFTYRDMGDMTVNYNYRDISRLVAKVKRLIKDTVMSRYGEGAVQAIQNGSFVLTRELFEKAFDSYHPSKKEDGLRELDAWDESMRKLADL